MRILQVAPYYSPQMGGTTQVVYQISRELANQGHDVTVVAGDFGIKKAAFPEENFNKVILPSIISRWGFYITPGLISWAHKHIGDFDVIHLHEFRTFQNIVIHFFANRFKVPYVISAHGTLPIIIQRQIFKQTYDLLFGNTLLESAHYLIAVSPTEVVQYLKAGVDKSRIQMIYNGFDLSEFAHLPPPGSFCEKIFEKYGDIKIILYLGRLHKTKGINYLIEAFHLLKMDPIRTLLVIAGPDDGELQNLKSMVNQLHLEDRVRFVGPLYGEDKLAAYVDADVLASPSLYEIFGLVAFEALLCGTPVVVSNNCGVGQIFTEYFTNSLVPYGDVEVLAKTLRMTLDQPQIAKQKVIAGQTYIRAHLDWRIIVQELEKLYQLTVEPYKRLPL